MRLGSSQFWMALSVLVFASGGASAYYNYVNKPDPWRHPPAFPTPRMDGSTSAEEEDLGPAPPPPTALLEKPNQPLTAPRAVRRFRHSDDQPYNNEPDPELARFYARAYSTGSTDAPTPMPLRSTTHTNVLLLGIDEGYGSSGRSDTIMVVSLGSETGTLNVLSIPRDTLVYIPGHGFDKINAAHARGRAAKSVETVQAILGVPIHHFITVDFRGAQKVLDVLGGVDLDVEKKMDYVDHSAKLLIHLQKGRQHLNGLQAACYLRFRHDNYGDIGRVYRQQRFIKAVTEKLRRPETLLKLPQLLAAGYQYIHTDMSILELSNLSYQTMQAMQGRTSLPTTVVPGYATMRRASYWIMDKTKTDQLVAALLIGNGIAANSAPLPEATGSAPPGEVVPPGTGVDQPLTHIPVSNYRPTVTVIVTRSDLRPYKSLLASLDKAGYRVLGIQTDSAQSHPHTHIDSHEGPSIPESIQEVLRSQLLGLVGTERVNIVEHTRQAGDYTVICGEDFPGLPGTADGGSLLSPAVKARSSPTAGARRTADGNRPAAGRVRASPTGSPPATPAEQPVVVTPEEGIVIEEVSPSASADP